MVKKTFGVLFGGLVCMGASLFGQSPTLTIPEGVLIQAGQNASFIARFALFVAVVLLWTIGWGKILKKVFRLPVIAGQIIGGILLGPSWLHVQQFSVFSEPITLVDQATGALYALASSDLFLFVLLLISSALTVSYLLWIAGHETDIKDILKVGLTAVSAGVFGAVVPIGISALFTYYALGWTFVRSLGLGLAFAATSVSIPVAMLFSLKKMHLKSSKATLGAAVIDDILAVIFLSVFFVGIQSGIFGEIAGVVLPEHGSSLTEALVYLIVSFAVIFATGYFCIPPVVRWLKDRHYYHLIASMAHGAMLLYFAFAELIGGLAGITGAYFAGLFHRMGDTRHQAEKTISPFVNVFLLPLFLGSIGLQLNVRILTGAEWTIVALLLILAIISKVLGCFMATGLSNLVGGSKERWGWLEGYIFGSSMVARGEVGLVVATILNGAHIITQQQYVIAVVVIVLTTVASPIMLSIGFNIMEKQVKLGKEGADSYRLNVGPFSFIGTTQMFNMISGMIEASGQYRVSVNLSEGRRIISLDDQQVKIILCPAEGLIFEGNRQNVEDILRHVKEGVHGDVEKLIAGI